MMKKGTWRIWRVICGVWLLLNLHHKTGTICIMLESCFGIVSKLLRVVEQQCQRVGGSSQVCLQILILGFRWQLKVEFVMIILFLCYKDMTASRASLRVWISWRPPVSLVCVQVVSLRDPSGKDIDGTANLYLLLATSVQKCILLL